jgi:hypothetical protein
MLNPIYHLPQAQLAQYSSKRLDYLNEYISNMKNEVDRHSVANLKNHPVEVTKVMETVYGIFHELNILYLNKEQKTVATNLQIQVSHIYNHLAKIITPSEQPVTSTTHSDELGKSNSTRFKFIQATIEAFKKDIYPLSDAELLSRTDIVRDATDYASLVLDELIELSLDKDIKEEVENLYSDLNSLYTYIYKKFTPLETRILDLKGEFALISMQMNAISIVHPTVQLDQFQYWKEYYDRASNNMRDLQTEVLEQKEGEERIANLKEAFFDLQDTKQAVKESMDAAELYLKI